MVKIDALLSRLKTVKATGSSKWVARCPCHEDEHASLSLSVDSDKILLYCHAGCATEDIVRSLGLKMSDLFFDKPKQKRTGITLAQLARCKGFDTSTLKDFGLSQITFSGAPAVRMPYHNEKGDEITVNLRIALTGENRFHVPKGEHRELYGLNWLPVAREKGFCVLCEGESDAWTCWLHDIPCVGVPGASNWKRPWTSKFDGVEILYGVQEPGEPGERFIAKLSKSFGDRLRVIPFEKTAKDPNELYLQDRTGFKDNFTAMMGKAKPSAFVKPPALHLSDLGRIAQVNWLWERWIPHGCLTLVVGEGGVGKTWLVNYIIACAYGDRQWPDSTTSKGYKTCLIETEHFRGEYHKRLASMGVKADEILSLPYPPEGITEPDWFIPSLPNDLHKLVEPTIATGGPWIVVVDSLAGAHELDENSAEMRSLLQALSGVASKYDTAVIAAHHLRKKNPNAPAFQPVDMDRIRGSSTIAQFARSIIGLSQFTSDGPVRVEVIKSNYAKKPPAFGFYIEDDGFHLSETPPEAPRKETQVDKACDLLLALLRKRPMRVTKLQEETESAGLSWITMKRAKTRLRINAVKKENRWWWSLPVEDDETLL